MADRPAFAIWSHFRHSRVSARVLAMFLLAAALPIMLLTVLAQRAIDDAGDERRATILSNNAKSAGILALDRLQLAAQALQAATPDSVGVDPADSSNRPLLAWVDVAADDTRTVRAGGDHAKPLLGMRVPGFAANLSNALGLIAGARGEADQVVLAHQLAGTKLRRLGLVNPDFLWADAGKLPPDMALCVVAHAGRVVFCSDPAKAASAEQWAKGAAGVSSGVGTRSGPAVWPLFLRASFGVPDWRFVASSTGGPASSGVFSAVLPAVGVASLLLATLLSLVQIRRTMTPLSRLATGARQIAAGRFDSRVHVRSGDEFGEMAQAFNDMATRLEDQFDELEALAAIDRSIIDHRALDMILGQVAVRLGWLAQGATVAIGRLAGDGSGPAICLVLRSGEAGVERRELNVDRLAVTRWFGDGDDLQLEHIERWPAELRDLNLGHHAQLQVLPLVTHNTCLGFMAIGGDVVAQAGKSAQRQLLELRNRAAVAVSAANREDTLLHEARHDNLTGLLNRAGLLDAMRSAGQRASADSPVTVLFIDVDRFKSVNDNHGHAVGDQVLRDVAGRIARRLPMGALLARPSGDEFVALLLGTHAPDAAARLAQTLCGDLSMVSVANVGPLVLGASIGIAFQDDPEQTVDELLRHADQAMYAAKRRGKGRHAFFEPELDVVAQRHALIERELPLAIERNELRLVYQPRVDARTRLIHSVEALVRWHHPTRGLCLPSEFIPVAEDSDLIERLGLWVLETACKQVSAWRAAGLSGVRVAVNLSARQLKSDRLEADLAQAMARHGVTPDDLELEITESVFVGDSDDVGERLQRLRAMGLLIALDDFGTGYSSMSYLRKLPVDVLKIDRSFVLDLDDDPAAIAVARAIVALATSLRLRTVAEGVETEGQLQLLTEMGCDEVQGYYFSRPVSPEALRRLVEQSREPSPAGA